MDSFLGIDKLSFSMHSKRISWEMQKAQDVRQERYSATVAEPRECWLPSAETFNSYSTSQHLEASLRLSQQRRCNRGFRRRPLPPLPHHFTCMGKSSSYSCKPWTLSFFQILIFVNRFPMSSSSAMRVSIPFPPPPPPVTSHMLQLSHIPPPPIPQ